MIKPRDRKNLKNFGENIRRLRLEKNLSLRAMSNACRLDNSKISRIERGSVNVTLTTLLELAEALNLHPSELLTYESE